MSADAYASIDNVTENLMPELKAHCHVHDFKSKPKIIVYIKLAKKSSCGSLARSEKNIRDAHRSASSTLASGLRTIAMVLKSAKFTSMETFN